MLSLRREEQAADFLRWRHQTITKKAAMTSHGIFSKQKTFTGIRSLMFMTVVTKKNVSLKVKIWFYNKKKCSCFWIFSRFAAFFVPHSSSSGRARQCSIAALHCHRCHYHCCCCEVQKRRQILRKFKKHEHFFI